MSHAPIYSERPGHARDRGGDRSVVSVLAVGSVLVAALALLVSLQYGSRDGAVVQIQHRIAYFGCDAAKAVRLAPARIGQPGYWRHLDPDNNGVSCDR